MIYLSYITRNSTVYEELEGDTFKITNMYVRVKSNLDDERAHSRNNKTIDYRFTIVTDKDAQYTFNLSVENYEEEDIWAKQNDEWNAKKNMKPDPYNNYGGSYSYNLPKKNYWQFHTSLRRFHIISKDEVILLSGKEFDKWFNDKLKAKYEIFNKAIEAQKRENKMSEDFND